MCGVACVWAGRAVGLSGIDQSLLIVTAGADHIAPPEGTRPLLGLVSSQDITRVDRSGGHIGQMAGSGARRGSGHRSVRGYTRRVSRNGSSSRR